MNDISDTEKDSPWVDPDLPEADGHTEIDGAESAQASGTSEANQDLVDAAVAELASLRTENADLREKLLLTIADMENLRRRTEREKQDAGKYAITRFAQDVLSVGDNLTRAIASMDDETRNSAAEGISNLIAGVEMTERELQNALSRHGITQLTPKGEKFDPNFHQAVFEMENPDVPSGTVIELIQAGYVINDRVLRPAMVGVSKGGPKAAPAPVADTAAETLQPEDTPDSSPEAAGQASAYTDPLEQAAAGDPGDDPAGHSVDKSA